MRRLTLVLLFLIIGAGFALEFTSTQAQMGETCPAFVDHAMAQVGTSCSDLGRNVACYGYDDVTASFYQNANTVAFSQPSDRVQLASLRSIRTAPLNEVTQQWGIALLNTQANLPNTAPGQSVIIMLVGDAQIENRVEPSEMTFTGETIPVSTNYDANLRFSPSLNARVIDSVARGTTLNVDMLNADGTWLRVAREDGSVAWISREVVASSDEIAALPRPEPTRMAPMQAFYFTAGLGQASCSEASGTVFIQGPNNIVVDLEVNGAEISIGSTIALSYNNAGEMQVATLSGTAYVEGAPVPAGYFVTAQVGADGTVVANTWQSAQPMTEADAARYDMSGVIPDNLLHYHVEAHPPVIITDNTNSNGSANCNCSNSSPANGNTAGNGGGNGSTVGNGGSNGGGNGSTVGNDGGNITVGGDPNVGSNCPGNNCDNGGNSGDTVNNSDNGNNGNNNCPGNSCNSNGNNGGGNGNANGNGNGNGNNGNGTGNCGNGNGNGNGANNGNGNGC